MYKNSAKPWKVYRNGILVADFATKAEAEQFSRLCSKTGFTITVKYLK